MWGESKQDFTNRSQPFIIQHPDTFLSFSGIVSLISLVILSYDRYSTLTVYNKGGLNYRKPLLAVGGSWLYSLFWTVPPLLGWSSYGLEGAGTSCSVSWTANTAQSHAYIICLFIFCLGLPILVMIYCYSRLLLAVKQVKSTVYVFVCGLTSDRPNVHPNCHWSFRTLKIFWNQRRIFVMTKPR